MASLYDPVPADSTSHRIPRKRVASDLIVGFESPVNEKHAYSSLTTRFNGRNDTQPEPAEDAPRERSALSWWSLEILSCFAAAACLAGIVALLAVYDGQPQQSWKSSAVTLNGVVAFLATMCRTFFMVAISAALAQGKWNQLTGRNDGVPHRLRDWAVFDDAAKGPWGSLQLLWRFKGLHIACVGAILTIMSLAFGLFAQQLLDVEVREVFVTGSRDTGNVIRTSWAASKREDATFSAVSSNVDLRSITRLAIYNGYMGTDIEDMTVNCATGNCTWPIIPTVGVCGACVDTTESIRVDLVPEIGLCNVTAPGNLTLRGSCNLQDFGPIMTIGPGTGEVFSRLDEAPPSSDALPVITQFGILGLPQMMPANTTINNSIATECGLWYCVQARKIWVDQGELHDEIVETSFTTQEIDSEVTLEAQRNGRINFTDIPFSFNTDPGEHYGIHVREMFALDKYFASILLGNVTMDGGLGVATPTTDFAEAAHIGLNDIDAWIQRLAKSMTNNIRTIGYVQTGTQELSGENAQPMPDKQPVPDIARYEGTARSNQVFFVVYWSWLAYPAAMVALAALYLGFEATRTSLLEDIRPWKDDAMMPLSMSLDEHSREVAREGLVEPKGARERLGRLEMTITRGDRGFPSGFVVREH